LERRRSGDRPQVWLGLIRARRPVRLISTMIHESSLVIGLLFRHAVRTANEQRLAYLCHHRASKSAEVLREGLDPDLARFIRDPAAA
jgi:hypothetical protein